jgi:hypothetical protein
LPGSIGSLGYGKIIKINTSNPNLVVNGDPNQQISLGETYYEAGASAYDVLDGDISGSVVRIGSVDTNKLGFYELTYKVVNSAKAETIGHRAVFVHNIVTGLPANNTSINSANISVGGGSDYLYQLDSENISASRSTTGTSSMIILQDLSAGEHILRIWGKNEGEDFWQSVPFTYRWNVIPPTVVVGGGGSMMISASDVRLLAAGGLVAETSSTSGKVLGVKVYQFKRILRLGSKGDDVKLLQFLLIKQKAGKSAVALSKTGITGYFGRLTENAMLEYTRSRKLKPSNGTLNKYIQGHFQQLGQDLNISMSKISSI